MFDISDLQIRMLDEKNLHFLNQKNMLRVLKRTVSFETVLLSTHNIIDGHEISNNVVCVTSKGSDQPAHMRSLIRAIAIPLNIL